MAAERAAVPGRRVATMGSEHEPWPSVSVQIITYNRPELLAQAVAQVAAQDYQGRLEVIVVDDSAATAQSIFHQHAGLLDVEYVHLSDRRYTIGEKRNLAVSKANGDIVCIWDDDDIFPIDRIRQQVSRMVARRAPCSSIQIAFAYSTIDGCLRRCRGLPLPFENSFCFQRDWLLAGRYFSNTSSGEGIALFKTSKDWYADAQPIPGEELPFLYIRTATSTAPDDALELYQIKSLLDDGLRLDFPLLSLARACRQKRFPNLAGYPGGAALEAVRAVMMEAIGMDLAAMRTGPALQLAPSYWTALGGALNGVVASPFNTWGDAGEAPEGSRLHTERPTMRPPTPRDLEHAGAIDSPSPISAEKALELIEQACADL